MDSFFPEMGKHRRNDKFGGREWKMSSIYSKLFAESVTGLNQWFSNRGDFAPRGHI